ncbi:DUF2970 domain-containing protein [Vreelandella rituensis]|uniref:DUF2970 domain-containing protein n=2 Tax=Vreelandella TaxID=3137766 RepID=A0A7X3KRD2_9GAMM|nr:MULTISPECIES: DUF2970 domain-containing protein [Halomonas]MWJ28261.1 DUF2970 domain-containing protein [Halomonas zhuhanensis]RCV90726.1 DUF2970 domain-containing protein [Halomonas rituensis]
MWGLIKSVLAAFLGVQKEEQRRKDFSASSPWGFIITAVILAIIFVVGLAGLAIWVAR